MSDFNAREAADPHTSVMPARGARVLGGGAPGSCRADQHVDRCRPSLCSLQEPAISSSIAPPRCSTLHWLSDEARSLSFARLDRSLLGARPGRGLERAVDLDELRVGA